MPASNGHRAFLLIGLALVGGAAWLYFDRRNTPADAPPAPPAAPAAPSAPPAPVVQHPLAPEDAAAAGDAPLPALEASDEPVAAALATLFGAAQVADWLVPERVLRRFVATVDNLPRPDVADSLRPLHGPAEPFAVGRRPARQPDADDVITLGEDNYRRYAPYIAALRATRPDDAAVLYRHFYPLLQQAYGELGYPDQYFNDRLVAVIDHLLETPTLDGPVLLVQPGALYEYADPAIEARSAGQKLLLRMGPRNAGAVKAWLRDLRRAVTAPVATTATAPQAPATPAPR